MTKKLLIASLLAIPFIANASSGPFPDSYKGVHIVPLSKMDVPEQYKKEFIENLNQQHNKGYQESNDSQYLYFLLNLQKTAPYEIKTFKGTKDLYDTHLKADFTEIKLAFPFVKIKDIKEENVIGYAPIGTYLKDKGWTGIKMFFVDPKAGLCAYSSETIEAVEMYKENTEFLINKKPTSKIIVGNINDGFVYGVTWYTNTRMNTLDCGNKNFDKAILIKMVDIGNKIDRVVSAK